MKSAILAIAATVFATSQGFAMDSLSRFEWQNRVLLVFGTSNDPRIARQIDILSGQAGALADRDMVILKVTRDQVVSVFGAAPDLDAARLREEAKIDGDAFEAVLVGKDGGVKLRSSSVVSDVELFELIDSMPMRRAGQS